MECPPENPLKTSVNEKLMIKAEKKTRKQTQQTNITQQNAKQ